MFTIPQSARSLLLILLFTALWNPRMPWQAPPVDLVVLVDASLSMAPAARNSAWRDVADHARRLPKGSRVAIVRFAATAIDELRWTDVDSAAAHDVLSAATPPHVQFIDDTHTDIAAATRHALSLAEPGRNARLVLISDGRATEGDTATALRLAHDAEVPLFLLMPPEGPGRDGWIDSLEAPNRIQAGHVLPVTVTSSGNMDGKANVVISMDGTPDISREVMLSPGHKTTVHVELPLPRSPTAVLSARLQVAGDTHPGNNRATQIINVLNASAILYVSRRSDAVLARSLRAGGWSVQSTMPDAFVQHLQGLRPGSIVLDDVDVTDLPPQAWETLLRTVTEDGTGLLVLGGPHAFGAGGYRHSRLEDILPVTAEARRPLPPAAVLFMLDTSGSMDRHDDGPSRLALARQAILESTRRLQATDALGLIEFAAEPHLRLPLAVHHDAVDAIRTASRSAPAGGTLLGPALRAGVAAFADVEDRQKLLILVTDGYVDTNGFADVSEQLRQTGIDVIALAIGSDSDSSALLPLTRINNGRLLRVTQVAQLPRLMRQEMDARRSLTVSGHFTPVLSAPLSFMPNATPDWPAIEEYAVTRERPTAAVYLRVQGDPLFAARYAGAGRVAAITTSLDAWQALWNRWPDSGRFAGGLMDWLDAHNGPDMVHLNARQVGNGIQLTLETPASGDGDEQDSGVFVKDPSGRTMRQELSARAPGRYAAHVVTALPGRYQAIVRVGGHQLEHDWLYGGNDEFMPLLPNAEGPSDWMRSGLLQPWAPSVLQHFTGGANPGTARNPLLISAASLYLLLLLWERRPDLMRQAVFTLGRAWHLVYHRPQPRGGDRRGKFMRFRHE